MCGFWKCDRWTTLHTCKARVIHRIFFFFNHTLNLSDFSSDLHMMIRACMRNHCTLGCTLIIALILDVWKMYIFGHFGMWVMRSWITPPRMQSLMSLVELVSISFLFPFQLFFHLSFPFFGSWWHFDFWFDEDWQYFVNCFSINFKIGYHFISGKHGPGNVVLVNSGADEPGISVVVEDSERHAGISFVNGQFMGGIIVNSTNTGPLKFTNCGFWGVNGVTDTHAKISGSGQVSFIGSHFIYWANQNPAAPAIDVSGKAGVTVDACDFMDDNHNQIAVSQNSIIDELTPIGLCWNEWSWDQMCKQQ